MTEQFWIGVAVGLVFGSLLMALLFGAVVDAYIEEAWKKRG